jgi:hypothetical protein
MESLHSLAFKGNVAVKGHRRRRPRFPPFGKLKAGSFAKDAKDGAPSSDEGAVEVKINLNGNGQDCPFYTGESPLKPKGGLNGPPVVLFAILTLKIPAGGGLCESTL